MLDEQMTLSKKLFKNGALNAIQLSGIYSNRVEARYELYKLESEYLNVMSQLYLFSNEKTL